MTESASSVVVRPLRSEDEQAWRALWATYLHFYREDLPPAISDRTFARLCEGNDMVGLLATDGDDGAVGFAHLVFHPSTWSATHYCYLEDLVVAPAARGSGVGAALINAVYGLADERGSDAVYWHTQEYNAPARSLYDQLAHRTSFVKYER